MPDDRPAHWLYPVNADSLSEIDTHDGLGFVSREGFRSLAFGKQAYWELTSGFRSMRQGDRLWVYFARPDKVVGALGHVLGVRPDESGQGHEVVLTWDEAATTALVSAPIPLALLGRAPRSVRRADPEAADILQSWLVENKIPEFPVPSDPRLMDCSRCGLAGLLPIAAVNPDLGGPQDPWKYRGERLDTAVTHGCGACGWQGTRQSYIGEPVRSAHELTLLLRPDATLGGPDANHLAKAAKHLTEWAGVGVTLVDASIEFNGSGRPGVVVEVAGRGIELSYPFALGDFWAITEFLVDHERVRGQRFSASA